MRFRLFAQRPIRRRSTGDTVFKAKESPDPLERVPLAINPDSNNPPGVWCKESSISVIRAAQGIVRESIEE